MKKILMFFVLGILMLSSVLAGSLGSLKLSAQIDCSVPEAKIQADILSPVTGVGNVTWEVSGQPDQIETVNLVANVPKTITHDLDPMSTNKVKVSLVVGVDSSTLFTASGEATVSACPATEAPEFGTVGAVIALIGAGAVVLKKRH